MNLEEVYPTWIGIHFFHGGFRISICISAELLTNKPPQQISQIRMWFKVLGTIQIYFINSAVLDQSKGFLCKEYIPLNHVIYTTSETKFRCETIIN